MTETRRIYRATALMSVGTGLSRITGLGRVMAMTFALGVTGTRLADTYNLANTTPNILFELFLGGVFTAVFVPVIVELRTGDGRDVSGLVSTSLLAMAVVAIVAAAGAPLIMRIYTFRIDDPVVRAEVHELATYLLRWFSPQIFFYGLSAVAEALLNVRRRFAPPKFAPVLNNLVVIGTLLGFAWAFGTHGLDLPTSAKVLLGAGTTAGVMLQALVLLPYLRGEGLAFRPSLRDPGVRRVLRLSGYVVGYVIVNQVGLWVVLALATGVRGGVTAYQIAFMFLQLPHGLFAVSLFSALVPELSTATTAGDPDAYRRWFHQGVRGVAYLLLPAAVGYWILADPLSRVLLARGVADAQDAALVAEVLRAFSVGLVSFSLFQLLTRCFYARQDTRTPVLLNSVAVVINIAVDIPLFALLGVRGLAFGHAIAYTAGAVMLWWALDRRLDGLGGRALLRPVGTMAAGTSVMGMVVWWIARSVPAGDAVVLMVSVVAGAILYLAFSQVVDISERRILLGWLRRGRGGVGGTAREGSGIGDEQGQIVVSWLVKLLVGMAIVGFVLVELGAVVMNRLQASDLANQAASEAVITYDNSGNLDRARDRAERSVTEAEAEFVGLELDQQTKEIDITVRRSASTFVLDDISAFDDIVTITVTESAPLRPR